MSDLYKDKIEISLDGRQVFYLFFGGALLACMVFVLGVLVGKRVEARAHVDRAATTAARDPLAALDRLAAGPRELSFRQALTGGTAPASEVDRTIAEMERARSLGEAPAATPVTAPVPVAAPVAAAPVAAAPPEAAKPAATLAPAKPGKWTLQLSAFQDRMEAETFLADIKGQGYDAFIVEAQIPDKGTFYRVRVGRYATYEDAVAAKTAFERKVKKIAYVSRI
jgi:cell division septation protein DedD